MCGATEIVVGEALIVTDASNELQDDATSVGSAPSAMVRVTLAPKITLASHQNDVPTILDLAVENTSDGDLEGLTLTVRSDPAILGERTWTAVTPDAHPADTRVGG